MSNGIQIIIDEFTSDITVTRARYKDFVSAEVGFDNLCDFIESKKKSGKGITAEEVNVLSALYLSESFNEEQK